MYILYICNMNLILEFFNEYVLSLLYKNIDLIFIYVWLEKNM